MKSILTLVLSTFSLAAIAQAKQTVEPPILTNQTTNNDGGDSGFFYNFSAYENAPIYSFGLTTKVPSIKRINVLNGKNKVVKNWENTNTTTAVQGSINLEGLPKGTYQMQLLIDNKVSKEINFQIK